jgi:hypothetical protein
VFVKNQTLFFYCYSTDSQRLHFALAEDMLTADLYGICGYIPANESDTPDIWVALWKVIPSRDPALGMNLLEFTRSETHSRLFSCCGVAERVEPIYNYLGYHTGILEHYYRIAQRQEYRIAHIIKARIVEIEECNHVFLVKINDFNNFLAQVHFDKFRIYLPFKDLSYIHKRYFQHIQYQYGLWGIRIADKKIRSVIIAREIECFDAKILRIVDFIGDPSDLRNIGTEIQRIMEENNYEYIDFYQFGIDEAILQSAGFIRRSADDPNIIPDHFEPFERKNSEIRFFTSQPTHFLMFKGDGDQDRPNIMTSEGDAE